MRTGMLLRTAPLLLGLAFIPACEPAEEAETDIEEGLEIPRTDTLRTDTAGTDTMAGRMGGMNLPRTVQFQPGPTGGTVSGTVRISEQTLGEGLALEVDLTGLQPGEYAWHIHSGSCEQEGQIVVPFTPTPTMEGIGDPLQVGDDGRATANVDVPEDRLPREQFNVGEFSLHVHEGSGADFGPTVACANLSGNTGGIGR